MNNIILKYLSAIAFIFLFFFIAKESAPFLKEHLSESFIYYLNCFVSFGMVTSLLYTFYMKEKNKDNRNIFSKTFISLAFLNVFFVFL